MLLSFALIAGLVWCSSVALADIRHSLHHQLSRQELSKLFSVDIADQVPDYDVFTLTDRRKRSPDRSAGQAISFSAFNRTYNLHLQANDRLEQNSRLLVAQLPDNGSVLRFEAIEAVSPAGLFQDVKNNAALLIERSAEGHLQMAGMVGEFVISRVPARLCSSGDNSLTSTKGQEDIAVRYNCLRNIPHIIYKINSTSSRSHAREMDDTLNVKYSPSNFNRTDRLMIDFSKQNRSKRSVPELYPEILVIVDYDTYVVHDSDIEETRKYILSFINAIDLRYRLTRYVTINLQVADIIIVSNRKSTPYLENNLVGKKGMVEATSALQDFAKFLYENHDLPSYDVAVAITKLDLCSKHSSTKTCDSGTAGYAYVGGACAVSDFHQQINSAAIVEDSGGFSGVIVASHELGHLLGSVHDGSPSPRYLGGVGAVSCSWNDGYIMSDLRDDQRGLRWSTCSLDQFAHFARDWRSSCMQNNPVKQSNVDRFELPGKLMTLDEQCQRDHGTRACFTDARVCSSLFCQVGKSSKCVAFRPAAEGSYCGRGKHCVHGLCKSDRYYY